MSVDQEVVKCPATSNNACGNIMINNNSQRMFRVESDTPTSLSCNDKRKIALSPNSQYSASLCSSQKYNLIGGCGSCKGKGNNNGMIPNGIEAWHNDGVEGWSNQQMETWAQSGQEAHTNLSFNIDQNGKVAQTTCNTKNTTPKIGCNNNRSGFNVTS